MNRELIPVTSREHWLSLRAQNLTSTEVPALFGLSPYQTEFEVWHRHKANTTVKIEENERMKWGNRLESAIALGIAEDKGFEVYPFKDYMRLTDLHLGSSFDYAIGDDGILEIKNVDSLVFRNDWLEDEQGNFEAPPHIEIQVQHQLLVSGRKFAWIGVLVGGNRVALMKREPDETIQNAILKKAEKFWKSIAAGVAPSPNFERDVDFLMKLHGYAEPGKVIDAPSGADALAAKYAHIGDAIKNLEAERGGIKAQLITMIGDAEKVIGEGFSISAGVVGPTRVEAFDKKGYRNFRVYIKKEKP